MEKVKNCTSLEEVRGKIDSLDKQIIEILARRNEYVKQAGNLKTDRNSVAAPERVKSMLLKRFLWARENQLDLYFIKTLFNTITGYFIQREKVQWDKKNNQLTKEIPIITKATPMDYKELFELQKKAYLDEALENGSMEIPPLSEDFNTFEKQLVNCNVFKAEYKEKIIGMVKISMKKETANIGRLVVHPLYQGIGLGSRLLEIAERSKPECNKYKLFTGIKSKRNILFYTHHGYKPLKTEENTPGLIYMQKEN